MKRILSALLTLSLVLTMLPVRALAEETGGPPAKTASAGENQTYAAGTITEHTLENGAVLKFNPDTGTITRCVLNGAASVAVPEELDGVTVTALGKRSFEELYTLESVTLPNTIVSIGDSAFSNARALTAIAIPDSVKLIDRLAFNRCKKLTSVAFGENSRLEHIGEMAFFMCGFSSFEVPNTIKRLDNDIFYGCENLERIVIPETVEIINSDGWFQDCHRLKHIVLPSHMTQLGARIFRGCSSLTKENVNIPQGITAIGDEAFMACSKFDSFDSTMIPEGVTHIGTSAFRSCSGLTEIVIPEHVTTLGDSLFIYSGNLKKVEILGPVTRLGDETFSSCTKLEEVILPDTVESIGPRAFHACNKLTKVDLPEGLKTIGSSAFLYCTALAELTLPAGVETVGENAICSSQGACALKRLVVLGPGTTFETGNLDYVPEGFVMYGHAGSPAETYAAQNGLTFMTLDQMSRTLTVKVTGQDGAALSTDFTVAWYDGAENKVGEGAALPNADPAKTYTAEVTLTGALAAQYAQPERKTFLPEDPAEWECRLVTLDAAAVAARVVGEDNAPLAGATVTISQNGVDLTETTGADGTVRLTPVKTVVTVAVSKTGYYTRRFTVDLSEKTELGDIVLTELVTDRIMVTAAVIPAAPAGETPFAAALSSLEGLAFTVTRGNAPIAFQVQDTSLVFEPGAAAANDTVTVTVTDTRGKYAAPEPVTVTLGGDKVGTCELSLIEKGGLRLGALNIRDARLMLFDAGGKSVYTGPAAANQTVSALGAGTYTVVLMEQNPLVSSVPTLARLGAFGLAQGTDFFQAAVTVADGRITQMADAAVPALNMDKLSVTKSASVKTNKPDGMIPGESFLVRAEFVLDEARQGEVQALELVIPDGIDVSGSVALVDGVPVAYSRSGAAVSVSLDGKAGAVVCLYCEAGRDTGEFSLSAALRLPGGGSQPIGAAVARVQNARIDVPEKTGKPTITASGKGTAGSPVAVYDNGVKIAETETNAIGRWTAELDLTKAGNAYSYSYHDLYAAIGTGAGALTTDTATVLYDTRVVSLKRLTYITNGQTKVLNYTGDLKNNPTYYYYSVSEPTFTFKAEFEGGAGLEEVYIHTRNNAGEETYVPAAYDESQKAWVAAHDYGSAYEAPVLFGVAYTPADLPAPPADSEIWGDFYQAMRDLSEKEYEQVKSVFDTDMPVDVSGEGELTIHYGDETAKVGTVSSEISNLTDSAAQLEQRGFTLLGDGKYIKFSGDGESIYISLADTAAGKVETETVKLKDDAGQSVRPDRARAIQRDASVSDVVGLVDTLVDNLPDSDEYLKTQKGVLHKVSTVASVWDVASNIGKLMKMIDGHYHELAEKEKEVRRLLQAEDCKGRPRLDQAAVEGFLERFPENETAPRGPLKQYKLESFYTGCTLAVSHIYVLPEALSQRVNPEGLVKQILGNSMMSKVTGYIYDIVAAFINHRYEVITDYYNKLAADIRAAYREDDGECEPEPDPTNHSPMIENKDIADPSGYVYEAVPSNRLAGVTAAVYQKQNGGEAAWNAEQYDQINPQTTAEDGRFQWDVPQGKWKVTLRKEGYESADSSRAAKDRGYADGWLDVPPPQFEVNIGMVSTAAPGVESVAVYTDRAEVLFSQYMDIDSVKGAVSLTVDGADRSVTVAALDEEAEPSGQKYARRFALVPTEGELAQGVAVSAAAGAKNYAGKNLSGAYTSEPMAAVTRPSGIEGPDSVALALTDGSPSVTVTLQPGLSGKRLTVESLAPEILAVPGTPVTTGTDGKAVVSLEPKLPGSAKLKVTEPDSGLTVTIPVRIAQRRPEPVTVHLADGDTVSGGAALESGTKLTLQTADRGAVIRYTLDDTCPCKDAALVYRAPLTITTDTILRAAAYKDGIYSATIRLELSVKTSAPSGSGSALEHTPLYGIDSNKGSNENGSWSTDKSSARAGDTVTITLYPKAGYQGTPTVKDMNGKTIAVKDLGGSKFSFVMPGGRAAVSAAFTPVKSGANPFSDVAEGMYCYDAVLWAVSQGITAGTTEATFSPETPCTRAQIVTFLWRAAGCPAASGDNPFTDVPEDSYCCDAVLWAVSQGITAGTAETTFSPETPCTRAQAVTFLYRAAGSPAVSGTSPFTDVASGAYYAGAVQWAAGRGVVNGTTPTTFGPEQTCTRAQIVTILYRGKT